ncbi:hypothetical protein V8G54_023988, partial [Vigna mungo]
IPAAAHRRWTSTATTSRTHFFATHLSRERSSPSCIVAWTNSATTPTKTPLALSVIAKVAAGHRSTALHLRSEFETGTVNGAGRHRRRSQDQPLGSQAGRNQAQGLDAQPFLLSWTKPKFK